MYYRCSPSDRDCIPYCSGRYQLESCRVDCSYGLVDTLNQPFRSVYDAKTRAENGLSLQCKFQGNGRTVEPVAGRDGERFSPPRFAFIRSCCRNGTSARQGLILSKGVDIDKDVAAELKELRELKKDDGV